MANTSKKGGLKDSKLGNSSSVTIGKRKYSYSSNDASALKAHPTETVKAVTGLENTPRNIAQHKVDNQANKIKTNVAVESEPLEIKKASVSPMQKKEAIAVKRNPISISRVETAANPTKVKEINKPLNVAKVQLTTNASKVTAKEVTNSYKQLIKDYAPRNIAYPNLDNQANKIRTIQRNPIRVSRGETAVNPTRVKEINKTLKVAKVQLNAPRNMAQPKVDNQANKINTIQRNPISAVKGEVHTSVKEELINNASNTVKTQINLNNPNVVNSEIHTSVKGQETINNASNAVKTQVNLNKPSVIKGEIHTSVKAQETINNVSNTVKTQINPNKPGVAKREIHTSVKGQKTINNVSNTVKTQVNLNKPGVIKSEIHTSVKAQETINNDSNAVKTQIINIKRPKEVNKPINAVKTRVNPNNLKIPFQNNILEKAVLKSKAALKSQDDSGTSTIATGLGLTNVGIKTFKTAQRVETMIGPYAVKAVKKTAIGTYVFSGKTVKVVKTAANTIGLVKNGKIKLDRQALVQFKSASVKKIKISKPIQTINHSAKKILNGVSSVKKYSVVARTETIKAFNLSRGIINGTVKIKIPHQSLDSIKNSTIKALKSTKRYAGYAAKQSSAMLKVGATEAISTSENVLIKSGKITFKGAYSGLKAGVSGIDNLSEMMLSSDDLGVQATGVGIKASRYTVITAKYSVKKIKTVSNNTIKTGKTLYRGGKGISSFVKMARKIGIKDTLRFHRAKAMKLMAKAGNSVAQALFQAVRALGAKVVTPVIIILIGFILIFNATSAPVSGVGAIFSGSFTNKTTGEDFEIHPYLVEKLPFYRQQFIEKILQQQNVARSSGYHFVRLFDGSAEVDEVTGEAICINDKYTPISAEDIEKCLSSTYDIVSIIEPVFHTIIFMEYNLEPTQVQINDTIKNLWNTIIKYEIHDLPREYCYDATEVHETYWEYNCDSYHADETICPNMETGVHEYLSIFGTEMYCEDVCCYWHHVTGITYVRACRGYQHCRGHRNYGITITMDGIYELMAAYFTDPINTLSNQPTRTTAEEEQLQMLKDNYDLCLIYMEEVMTTYGGAIADTDLSGVVFIEGERPNNDNLVRIAEQQLGNIGGQPYWSWYGFRGRVEWCACFVSWCVNQSGNGSAFPKYCKCTTGMQWFIDNGQFAAGDYTELAAGDIIFFDWNGDGLAQHTGIVVGTDGSYVYTIEGNSGDVCRRRKYPINSSVILGYGLPNYYSF